MRRLFLASLITLLSSAAYATVVVPGTAGTNQVSSGVDGEDLADTPVTDTIPVGAHGGVVELSLIATAGTSTSFTASCEHSENGSNWVWIESTDAAGTATKAVVTYTITSVTARTLTVSTRHMYIRCTLDDAVDGTGTIIVRGNTSPF